MRPVIAVHAGAGTWKYLRIRDVIPVIERALRSGMDVIASGGTAVDAVVKATMVLEDSGLLNAGLGSVVDLTGKLTMDAGVMDGETGGIGAVAAVTYPKNPVLLAKKVMELTDHVLLAGEGADKLAKALGMERHPGPTERVMGRYRELLAKIKEGSAVRFRKSYELALKLGWLDLHDTVGAVALDREGRLAAAVSTGGVIMKFPGRVGDSAIPGAGFYATQKGAAVATGIGEVIIKSFLSLGVIKKIESGLPAMEAAERAIDELTKSYGRDTAGVLVVDSEGNAWASYNTEAMPWGFLRLGDRAPTISGLPSENEG